MEHSRSEMIIDILPRIAHVAGMGEFAAQMEQLKRLGSGGAGVIGGGAGSAGGLLGTASTAGIGLAAGVGTLGILSTQEAISVESASNRVIAAHDKVKQNIAEYTRWVTDNSAKLLTSQQDLWNGIGTAVEMGWGVRGTEAVTTGAAKMTGVLGGEFQTNLAGVTGLLKDLGATAQQIPQYLDLFTAAAARSGMGAAFFSTGLSRLIVQAVTAGASPTESLGVASELDKLGLGNRGVGAFGTLLPRLQRLQTTGYGNMVNLGKFGIVGSLQNLMGQSWATPAELQKLLGGSISETLAQQLVKAGPQGANLGNTQGTLQSDWSQYLKSADAQLKALNLTIKDFETQFGKGLLPLVKEGASELTGFTHGVGNLLSLMGPGASETLTKWVAGIGLISIAYKGLRAIVGPMISDAQTLAEKTGLASAAEDAETASTAKLTPTLEALNVQLDLLNKNLTAANPQTEEEAAGIGNLGRAAATADPEVSALVANLTAINTESTGASAKLDAEAGGIAAVGAAADAAVGTEGAVTAGAGGASILKGGSGLMRFVGMIGLAIAGLEILKGVTDSINSNPGSADLGGFGIYGGSLGNGDLYGPGAGGPYAIGGAKNPVNASTPGSAFGLGHVTYSENQRGWLQQDQNIQPTAIEMNYGLPNGSKEPFSLPSGSWKVLRASPGYNGGVGGILTVQNLDTGQELTFLHLSSIAVHQGDVVHGGQKLGTTGWPQSPQYAVGGNDTSTNAHLAVLIGPVPSGGAGGTSLPTMTSPAMLNAVKRQEGPTYGVTGETGNQARTSAGNYLSYWYDWTGTPAGQAAMRAHGLNPNSQKDRELTALAIYNAGPNAKWWESYSVTVNGTSMPQAMAYANQVMGFATGGSQTKAASGGSGGATHQYAQPSTPTTAKYPTTPAGWAAWWGTGASKDDQMITDLFGPNIDISKLTPAEKALLISIIDSRNYDQYMQARSLISAEVPGGVNSPAGAALLRQAAARLSSQNKNPLAAYKSTDPLTKAVSNETALYNSLSARWSGVDPTALPPAQQHQWLQGQYKMDTLWRQIHDNTAKIEYHAGKISLNTLQQILQNDKAATNKRNQDARRKAEGDLGAVGRVAVERVTSQCAAEARANVHRKVTADSSKELVTLGRRIAAEGIRTRQALEALLTATRGGGKGSTQAKAGQTKGVGNKPIAFPWA